MNVPRIAPWAAAALAVVAVAVSSAPPRNLLGLDVEGFSRLPLLEGGRVKPFDSLARNSLLMIRGQQSFAFEGRTVGADEWLLDVLFRPQVADRQKIFAIDDPEVLGLLGLQQTRERYFAFTSLAPAVSEIERQANAAHPIDAKKRTRFQSAVVVLFDRIYLYYQLRNSLQLDGSQGLAAELGAVGDPAAASRYQDMVRLARFRPVPPPPGMGADAWRSVGESLRESGKGRADPYLAPLARLGSAYTAGDPSVFSRAVGELRALAQARAATQVHQASQEAVFNRVQPFYLGMVLYVLALLVLFASWVGKPGVLQPAAFALALVGAACHTGGLIARVVLQGRPPVTNLYSSAIFVGWAAVVLGLVVEKIYRRGFGTAVSAAAGFATLIVAHHLSVDGDTMEMMRAVLDSNFWLATHVVAITIGYSGTFLAGAIAIGWVLRRHLAKRPNPETSKALVSTTYGVVCFALLFSFVGTVLGGIWADQSWGRFWGWDPKENGALLIVLWNAIILHARWGGYARERGIMAMAIFGNVITSLSWFGVNMLGVGLHSYGFMDKAFWALSAFVGTQLLLMALAVVPARFWAGRGASEVAPAAQPAEAK
jgi:ABC-type transport system involved in cytochrome c biogenesis permease subunit